MGGEMKRGFDSLPIVVEEEKHAMNLSIQTVHGWVRPCPLQLSCLAQPGANGPQLAVGILESGTKDHPRLFGGLLSGNMPTEVEAFPTLFFSRRGTHLKALWIEYRNLRTRPQLCSRERYSFSFVTRHIKGA
jgi:hypothetical protein